MSLPPECIYFSNIYLQKQYGSIRFKIKIFFYNMSYSYLYVGKVDVKINTLSYFNKIESVYTSSTH